mmetsp:Transcript_7586/g.11363  ORF Transcript_7586/g.11363 Transcript_7586/m.11363 type:complete len:144 (-) Transcript_7586:39-470(-)|eukprot:CAMPEP_0171464086 /NCGR_PEP_ID=MMETSP0945-20130129/7517_1 /TAXON_ID=109269 /ORGANISM="Vaucheria litorea, Strain CCMP2940" /LENGTH=143 /DNA_ID=CAMNT_0011991047 /DNA_START=51 /DNA_END=482 /DNA_ORIENTATION=+
MKFNPNVSSSRRKSRKAHFSAHSTARAKIMSAPLSKELQQEHHVRAMPIRVGDEVQVVRGSNSKKGGEGKVVCVYRKKFVIHVEGMEREKSNGQMVKIGIHPSKVIIKRLHLNKDRNAMLARKSSAREASKGKFTDAEIGRVD